MKRLFLAIAILMMAGTASGATITVCASGCDQTSLDAAVAASSAGDTVSVTQAGSYTCSESINGKSNLTIQNDSGGAVIVTASGGYFLQTSDGATDNVVIDGLTFGDGTNAFNTEVIDADNTIAGWVIKNCTFAGYFTDETIDCTVGSCGITIQNSTYTSAGSTKDFLSATKGGTIVVSDFTSYGDATAGANAIFFVDTAASVPMTFTVDRWRMYGTNGSYSVYARNQGAGATTTVTLNYCIFTDYENGTVQYYPKRIYARDYGVTVTLNNCVLSHYSAEAFVLVNGTGGGSDLTVTVNNSIVTSLGSTTATGSLIANTTNTPIINANNTYLNGFAVNNQADTKITTCTNCIRSPTNLNNMNIGFKSYAKPHGYIAVSMDDTEQHSEYQKSVVDVWKAKGVKGTLFVNPGSNGFEGVDLSGDANFQSLIDASYDAAREWGVHSWSHAGLHQTVAFTIKMKTADTATLNITETAFTIDCSNDAGDISLDLTSGSYDSIHEIYNALAGAPYSTYYTLSAYTLEGTSSRVQATSLADVTARAIPASAAAAYNVLLDTGAPNYRYYRDELQDTKAWLVANTNATASQITAMASPGSNTNAATIAYLKAKIADDNVALAINRGNAASGYTPSALGSQYNLRNINTYLVQLVPSQYAFGPSTGGSRTQAEVTSYATALAVWVRQTGAVVAVYAHGDGEDTGANLVTAQEWGWFIDAAKTVDPNIFKSFGEIATLVHASPWAQNETDGEVYNTVFTDQGDYRLSSGSVAINAGIAIDGLTTDFLGNPIKGLPDIGAYEFSGGCPFRLVSYSQSVACYGGSGTRFDRAKSFYNAFGCYGTMTDMENCYTTAAGCTGSYIDRWLCTLGITGGTSGINEFLKATYGN